MDSLWTISDKILFAGTRRPPLSGKLNNTFIIKKIKIALIMGRKFVHISATKISHFIRCFFVFYSKRTLQQRESLKDLFTNFLVTFFSLSVLRLT